ncbi:DUF4189 domain-containing protein [Luteimonas sp. SX5]|uniref:DUF4189 domain-containing protein n=1 Tax=Luteimonas galliterrae TaxID=2940486 RepID=A0ABT0MLP8_9GAMM|nr:DUF4189 domain-containing protein [Luteimonas galliterrae]MCL1635119.1 DUF4189 domain-containing protein [Luteimonas galliterrae]
MKKISALLVLLMICGELSAQSCGGGIPSAGNPYCLPPYHPSSPHYQGQDKSNDTSNAQWRLTWGAVAMSANGDASVGVSVGRSTRMDAEQEAITQCELLTASRCELAIAYENQCAVIAWPSRNGATESGSPIVMSGPSVEKLSKAAVAECGKGRKDGECKIVYSDCTKPVLVQ